MVLLSAEPRTALWTEPGLNDSPARRVLTLALLAATLTTFALTGGRVGLGQAHVATPHFLSRALGRRLSASPSRALVPKRFARGGYATPAIASTSFSLSRGGASVALRSTAAGAGAWSAHAGGVTRSAAFGRATITLGRNSIEQFLTVDTHFGERTWKWSLAGLGLSPRLGTDGEVHFYKHGKLTGWRIARPLIQDDAGNFVTPGGTHWDLEKRTGGWILALTLDDSQLPVPYTIDPGIALTGACSIGVSARQPAIQAGCTTNTVNNTNSVALTVPSGVVDGDVMIAHVVIPRNSFTTVPSGWTQVGSTVTNTAGLGQGVWYRVASGETAGTTTYTWGDASGGKPLGGGMYAFSSTNTTTPVDVSTTNSGMCGASGSCTETASAVTTTQANDILLALYSGQSTNNPAQDSGEGMSQGYTQTATAGRTKLNFTGASGTAVQASPGSSGSYTATASAAGQNWVSTTVAVQAPFEADGGGTVSTNRTNVAASSTGNTVQFTYTVGTGGMSGGSVAVAVPAGWTAPVTTNGSGCTTASAGTLSVSGQTITVGDLTLAQAKTLTITYGATSGGRCASGDGATATATTGAATWTVASKATSGGTLTPLADNSSPSITVNAADGSGTSTVSPTITRVGATADTLIFTYAVAAGGTSNGEVDVTVPSGWTSPTTSNAAGCVTASTGSVAVAGSTIKVTGVTLSGGATMTITYGATSGGSCAAGDTATAPSSAQASTFATSERSANNANDTRASIGASPTVTVSAAGEGTMVVSPASVGAGTSNNSETFTYTNGSTAMSSGAVSVVVPANWSAPSTTSADPGYTTSSIGTVGVSGQTITVTGVTLGANASMTITYGASSAAASPLNTQTGSATWTTQQKAFAGGTLTSIASSPSVSVTNAADGTGTITASPLNIAVHSTGATLTFSYTPGKGGTNNGEVRLRVPPGWTTPSTLSGSAGYSTASGGSGTDTVSIDTSTGSCSVSSPCILVSGVTLTTAQTLTIIYGSGGGAAGVTAPGSTGTATFTTSEASTSGGALASTSIIAPTVMLTNGNFTTNAAVSINGTPTVGTASTLTAGSYTPAPTSSSYQWELCDSGGANCSDIGGATSSTYTPAPADVGHTLRVVETVTHAGYNDGGSTSAASPAVIKADFTTISVPSVNGRPTVGKVTTITNGVYSPITTTRSYQWQLCDSNGANCSNIPGATGHTYTPVAGDPGSTLRVVETVSRAGYNDGGSTSGPSSAVIDGDFSMSAAVSINGTPTVGTALTVTAGSYSPTPTSRSYQWEVCNGSGGSCSSISGATSTSYIPVAADAGLTLRVVATVSAAGYNSGRSTSAASAVVADAAFTTNSAVVVNGTPAVGAPATNTGGSYAPSPAGRSYQWQRCDSGGANCSNIPGATSGSYTPVAGDVGSTLRVVEVVRKAGYGDSGSTSAASAVVVTGSFSVTAAVSVRGTPVVGKATPLTAGSFTPAPSSSSYQWELCDSSGNNCSNISGATTGTYTPLAGDVGSTLRVVEAVSASGYHDRGSTSSASPVVVEGTLATTSAVMIDGHATVGTATRITRGVYSAQPTTRSYQWELCDSSGAKCSNIGGATRATYTPGSGDIASTLRVVETVTRAGYKDGASTSSAIAVTAVFTTNAAVAINGRPRVGTRTTITAGSYAPSPARRSYQWKRCNRNGTRCVKIPGATYRRYIPVAADAGKRLRVVETVTRPLYPNRRSMSARSALVAKGTFGHTRVAIFGYPKRGVLSHIMPGSYTPNPTRRTYRWLRCSGLRLATCVTISGATSNTYRPRIADRGKRLRVIETVSKPGYNTLSITSLPSAKVP